MKVKIKQNLYEKCNVFKGRKTRLFDCTFLIIYSKYKKLRNEKNGEFSLFFGDKEIRKTEGKKPIIQSHPDISFFSAIALRSLFLAS